MSAIRYAVESDGSEIWLEPKPGDEYIGLRIGFGMTKEQAFEDAELALQSALAQLKEIEKQASPGFS